MRKAACNRIAWVLYDLWEDGIKIGDPWYHTRFPDFIVREKAILFGRSINGEGHKEHVVPLSMLLKKGFDVFESGGKTDDFTRILMENLYIVTITKDEAKHLDSIPGLKTGMPENWGFGDDPFARLAVANIEWKKI